MSVDIIARAMAVAARSGGSGGSAATPIGRFSDLPSRTIDSTSSAIVTSGYATPGIGRGCYVADSTATAALAAAHARFCKADAAGRYFRLLPDDDGLIPAACGGATGSGNDQPAIQAAANYAAAVGARGVRLLPVHESWQPTFPGGTPNEFGGCHLLITGDVALIGAPGGTRITLKGQGGAARTKTDGNATWLSSWLYYTGTAVTRSVLRDIKVDGGLTYVPGASSNLYDKGIIMADWAGGAVNLVKIDHRNVELTGFAGEIWYMGGTFRDCEVYVENLKLSHSQQCTWNAGTLAKVVAVNLVSTDAYQVAEITTGMGHLYIGGYFARAGSGGATFMGTQNWGTPYNLPTRDTSKPLTFATFEGTVFDTCSGTISIGCWTRGRITTIDTSTFIGPSTFDIDLEIEAWCDVLSNDRCLVIGGPSDLTTQFPGAAAGTYYTKPHDVRVRLHLNRTDRAKQAGIGRDGVAFFGLIDKTTVSVEVSGAGRYAVYDFGSYVSGFTFPLVKGAFQTGTGAGIDGYAPVGVTVGATASLDPIYPVMSLSPNAAGTATINLGGSYGYCHGQRVRLVNIDGHGDRFVQIPASGTNHRLPAAVTLGTGDFVDLEWSLYAGKWLQVK